MSFLGRLNYISRFISQSNVVCEPIFKLLKKDTSKKCTEECQTASDAIKSYLSNPPLVPPREGSPLFLYLSFSDSAFGCVLCQHDTKEKKERVIYYISKKFTPYEFSLHFVGDNVLCFDVAYLEAETLFVFLYYIPHFQNGFTEVYLPESDADRKVS